MFQNSNPKNILSHHRGSSGSGKLYTEGEEPSEKSHKNIDVLTQLAE